jgi:hypothetical protein
MRISGSRRIAPVKSVRKRVAIVGTSEFSIGDGEWIPYFEHLHELRAHGGTSNTFWSALKREICFTSFLHSAERRPSSGQRSYGIVGSSSSCDVSYRYRHSI